MIFDQDLSIEVVRTKRRKTASIKVIDGAVQAIVPNHISDERVFSLIQKRTPWIRKKLYELSQVVTPSSKEYVNGESFTYLGRNYRLKVIRNTDQEVKLKDGYLEVSVSKKSGDRDIWNALVEWYEQHALERLTEKTNRYAGIMGVSPNSVSVRDYKSRWGSCSPKGEISYNWRINWNAVKREVSDYKGCRQWLKENGCRLAL